MNFVKKIPRKEHFIFVLLDKSFDYIKHIFYVQASVLYVVGSRYMNVISSESVVSHLLGVSEHWTLNIIVEKKLTTLWEILFLSILWLKLIVASILRLEDTS